MRLQIARREPIICLKPFNYRSRPYKEGDILDRRRVRMTLRKLRSLIDGGFCQLARTMKPAELKKHGFMFDKNKSPRWGLCPLEEEKPEEKDNPFIKKQAKKAIKKTKV